MKLIFLGMPIGRLKDVSILFLETISKLKFLAVEDTRSMGQFLILLKQNFPQYKWEEKRLISCYQQNERQVANEILELVKNNQEVGFMSEAGMPGISDPGGYLLTEARKQSLTIEMVPGPSALTTALSLSGFEAEMTIFIGFFPKKTSHFSQYLLDLGNQKFARSVNLVFFQSPYRIKKTVKYFFDLLPTAKLFLAREMTKKFEQHLWLDKDNFDKEQIMEKGEYTGVLNIVL